MTHEVGNGDLIGKGVFSDLLGPEANPESQSHSNGDGSHHYQQKDDEAAHTAALLDQKWSRVAVARDAGRKEGASFAEALR